MGSSTKLKSDDGFTLIELMIATVVFTFGLVAVLTSVMSMFGQQRYDEYDAIASNYMNFFLDDLQDGITLSGNIVNVQSYLSPFDGTQLFTAGGGNVDIPEIGSVNVTLSLGAAGPGVDTVEVGIAMVFLAYDGRRVTKTGSRIITY